MLQTIAIYLLKTIIVSALLIVYYWFALRNKRFHYYNRFYLLSAVVLSMVLPLLNLNLFTFSSNSDKAISMFNVIYAEGETEFIFGNKAATFNWQQLFLLLTIAISAVLLLMLTYRIITIYRIKKKFPVSPMQEFDFVNTDLQQAPFSFLKNIFWRNDISLEENAGRLILQHELTHIKEKHTWDKLFMQVVIAVFWMNPLYRLIQKELYLIHEFIADDKSVADKDTAAFAEMLLHAHYGKFSFDPAQPFFYSPIKRRLIMLTTSKEPRFSYVRRMMALPLLACVILLFAFRLQKENNEVITTVDPAKAFSLVVDAGHGGSDNGAIGIGGLREKDIVLTVSKKIKELSGEYGIDVTLVRDNDNYLSPQDKVAFSEKQQPDAFVSIHVNAASANQKTEKSGMEIYVSPDNAKYNESKILGSAVLQKLGADFKVNTPLMMRKVGIWVLKANTSPSILIECGYITNENDLGYLKDDAKVEEMARKILEGVAAYANNGNNPVESLDVKLQDNNAIADTTPAGNKNVIIKQQNANHNQNTNLLKNDLPNNVLYVLNGELKNKSDIDKLTPENIKSIDVLKGESATKFYGDKGQNGVIVITTKDFKPKTTIEITEKGEAPLYVVDGNFMSAEDVKTKLDPNDILSVNVIKGEQATKAYGDNGKNGVVEITTKNAVRKGNGIIRQTGFEAQKLLLFGNNNVKC